LAIFDGGEVTAVDINVFITEPLPDRTSKEAIQGIG
jgi:hypothetical protein